MVTASVIVPCLNEEGTIGLLLEAIHNQTFPLHELEVIIADGLSTDQTRARISDFKEKHPDMLIKVVDNPARIIPCGLNNAIDVAQGEYIVRLDAHSIPAPDYIERSLENLKAGYGDNVGGLWEIKPGNSTPIARAIAKAAAHPFGAGDVSYRTGGLPRNVDTVPFGAFRRSLIHHIGKYNEELITNEDYELNARIRQAGGKIWFDPQIRSVYFARSDLRSLARQYLRYGYWKAQMLRRYPKTLRWRQLLPPLFVTCLAMLMVLSLWFPPVRWILIAQIGMYGMALFIVGYQESRKENFSFLILGVPLAIATMHLSWGTALIIGLLFKPGKDKL
jgi:glycosyltransferase involved in cell wall biosynthesis